MVRNKFLGTNPLLGIVISIGLISTGCGQQQQATQPQALPVQLKTLETATMVDSSQFVGTLESKVRVSLAPKVDGRILEILVSSGAIVTTGTPLVLIDPEQQQEEVNARQGELQSAQANLRSAESDLAKTKEDLDAAKAQLARAKAALKSSQADLNLAEVNYERAKFLVSEGVLSQVDLDTQTRELQDKQAALSEQQEEINSQSAAVNAAEKQIQITEGQLENARSRVATAQANVGAAVSRLDDYSVVAPIDGVVGDIPIDVGDFVNIGQQLTTLTNNQEFDLRISVPVERRSQLRLGLPVEIINSSDSGNVSGEITFIAPNVNQNTQSILTKATFANDGSLRDSQFVRARIIWNETPGVLVPTTAVSSLGGQKFVFVAETNPEDSSLVAKQQPVKLGPIQGQAYQVISGLEPGDRIAVSRILDLSDGRLIQAETVESQSN